MLPATETTPLAPTNPLKVFANLSGVVILLNLVGAALYVNGTVRRRRASPRAARD